MADVLWISEQDFIDNSVVIDSVDFKLITPNIIWVQDEYIQGLLGTDLFNSITSQINASTEGTNDAVSTLNQTLIDNWIKKVLINYIMYESAPDMVYRWTNKGLETLSSDNSQIITPEALNGVRDKFRIRAEKYADRLTRYLIQENASYPLYNSNSDFSDEIAKTNSFNTGIFMDRHDFDDDCFNNLHNRQTRG